MKVYEGIWRQIPQIWRHMNVYEGISQEYEVIWRHTKAYSRSMRTYEGIFFFNPTQFYYLTGIEQLSWLIFVNHLTVLVTPCTWTSDIQWTGQAGLSKAYEDIWRHMKVYEGIWRPIPGIGLHMPGKAFTCLHIPSYAFICLHKPGICLHMHGIYLHMPLCAFICLHMSSFAWYMPSYYSIFIHVSSYAWDMVLGHNPDRHDRT